jgi:hypothetical protein
MLFFCIHFINCRVVMLKLYCKTEVKSYIFWLLHLSNYIKHTNYSSCSIFQVSKCEKFGYGVMVTQIAATGPGVVSLETSGNTYTICYELFRTLYMLLSHILASK